jgi:transcriptional regulator with XRE-family HTH domain
MRLKEARIRKLLSVRRLAILADVAPSVVYYAESGQRTPQYQTIEKIASALEVEPMEIDEFREAIEGKSVA